LRSAGARASFGVFGCTARTAHVAAAERPAVELAARSEFRVRRASARIGFGTPASPLAHCPGRAGCSRGGLGRSQLSDRSHPLFELGSPVQFCPVQPEPSAAAGRRLPWTFGPFSTCKARRSTDRGHPKRRDVPPSGFGYPLGGFLPPSPGRLCFTPAALMGFTLRSFLLAGRSPERFRPDAPTCRFSTRFTNRRSGGPARAAAAPGVFPFRESLARRRAINPPSAGCSPGFRPSRACGRRP
jgi:hypothetical protein